MMELSKSAAVVSMFCRMNIHIKKELPIRSSEMGLLIFIHQSEFPPTSADAVEFFCVSKPMVAAMVRSLESKGYICKGKSSSTMRRFTLLLTEEGRKLATKTTGEYFKNISFLNEKLGDKDFATLVDLLDKANALLIEEQKRLCERGE